MANISAALGAYRSGRVPEASRICTELLRSDPRHLGALNLLGAIKAGLGAHAAAVELLRRALEVAPSAHRTLSNLGLSLSSLGRHDEALECFTKALTLVPGYAVAWYNQGVVLRELRRHEAALDAYDKAIAIEPAFPDALCNRGDVLHDLGRVDDAVASYDRAIALRPAHPATHAKRGKALCELQRPAEGIEAFDRTLAFDARNAPALRQRGMVLLELHRYKEAVATFDRAITVEPSLPQLWVSRGQSLREDGEFTAALASFERAVELDPDYPDAHWNVGFTRLLLGDLATGFREYEWRWRTVPLGLQPRPFSQPPWLGDGGLEGKRVLVYAEQGYGDTVQMVRFARTLAERGATVALEVPPRLVRLLEAVPGVSTVLAAGEPLPPFDLHCPIMSLPFALGTHLETIPRTVPYIRADGNSVEEWRARLGPRQKLRVGVTWSGNPVPPKRSISLDEFSVLFDLPVEFVSLQTEIHPSDRSAMCSASGLVHFGDEQKDFADTAAIIESLDLVISIDTAVAHVAGAMGKPLWLLLPFSPDWRWLVDRRDSPWYPAAELFRQSRPWDWKTVLEEVRRRLLIECNRATMLNRFRE